MSERVSHPDHYTWLKKAAGIEVIDITRHMNFDLGNVIKYVLRAGHKHEEGMDDEDKCIEDLKKAQWYLEDEIRRLSGLTGNFAVPSLAPLNEKDESKKPMPHMEGKNVYNGHEYVDLGLSVLWATCNVGAKNPEDCGDCFPWRNMDVKENCNINDDNIDIIKGMDYINDISSDTAYVKWGGGWRMPKTEEFEELMDKCIRLWTTLNGIEGCEIIGPNNNSIFFPADNCLDSVIDCGNKGKGSCSCWSSSYDMENYGLAASFFINRERPSLLWNYYAVELPVRPVLNRSYIGK